MMADKARTKKMKKYTTEDGLEILEVVIINGKSLTKYKIISKNNSTKSVKLAA